LPLTHSDGDILTVNGVVV